MYIHMQTNNRFALVNGNYANSEHVCKHVHLSIRNGSRIRNENSGRVNKHQDGVLSWCVIMLVKLQSCLLLLTSVS